MEFVFDEHELDHALTKAYDFVQERSGVDRRRKKFKIKIVEHKAIRSLDQNAYYWGVVVKTIALSMGDTKEDTHDMLCRRFNPVTKKLPDGEVDIRGGSTHDMDMEVFWNTMVQPVRNWWYHKTGYMIPDPVKVSNELFDHIEREYNNLISS